MGEERLPGLWLPKPLLNSPSHPAQGLVSGGGEQMSAGQTEVWVGSCGRGVIRHRRGGGAHPQGLLGFSRE